MGYFQDWNDAVVASLQNLWAKIIAYLPELVAALVVLIIGLILAKILSRVAKKLVELTKVDKIVDKIDSTKKLEEAGMPLKVRQKNAQWIMPTGDERLTLVTCWPYEWPGNSHRVIVVARPHSYFEIPVEEALGGQSR